MKDISPLMVFVIATWATWVVAPGSAQAGSGFYVSGDLGINIASGLDTTGTSNDRASVCDEYINLDFDTVTQTPGYENFKCTGPDRGAGGRWENEFDGATGILAGGAVGYSFADQNPNSPLGGLRVELEYFYRQSSHDQTADISFGVGPQGDKLRDEIVQATDRIGSITSHNLFGNLYYDFSNTSRFTPYIGIGGGVGVTNMEYGSLWVRADDPAAISTGGQRYEYTTNEDGQSIRTPIGEPLPNAHQIQQNLAKTFSSAQATLSDVLYGLQILFGVDYAITEATSLGLKGRWVRFGSFSDDFIWNPLRSHEPFLRKSGPDREPVSGRLTTDNVEFFGVSVNLKYHF